MANPINSNIGPHVSTDTTGPTALITRIMTDPNNNIGNQLYKLYSSGLDDYYTRQGSNASLEAKALYDQGKTFSDVLPSLQDKYSSAALAKAKLDDVYSGSLKDISEREGNERGWQNLELSRQAGDRDQQRINIAKATAAREARQSALLEQVQRLIAEYSEAKAQGLGRSWIDKNRSVLQANPYAMNAIFSQAGTDLIDYSPDDAEVSKNLMLVDPNTVRDQVRNTEEKMRALANTEGMSLFLNPDGSVRHTSSNEVFEKMAKGRGYTGRDYSKFRENWDEAYSRIKSQHQDLDDATIGAILEKTVGTRTIFSGNIPFINNRVDDWNTFWNGRDENTAKAADAALKYLSTYKNLADNRERLNAIQKDDSVKNITSTLTTKVKNIQAAVASGRVSAEEGRKAIDRARAEASASITPIIQMIDTAIRDGAGVPNTLKKTE